MKTVVKTEAKTEATKTPPVESKPTEPAKPTTVTVIKVLKKDGKFGGARKAWYDVILAHDGKPLQDLIAAVTAKPPSTPKKGVLAGKLEPPMGWVGYFKRSAFITLEEQPVKAS